MTEAEVRSRLNAWAATAGGPTFDDPSLDFGKVRDDLWIVAPTKRANVVYIVTEHEVRAVHPSQESVPDVLRQLGVDVDTRNDDQQS